MNFWLIPVICRDDTLETFEVQQHNYYIHGRRDILDSVNVSAS